jgi:hypothetical protein
LVPGFVQISVRDAHDAVRELAKWLRDEDAFRSAVRLDEAPISTGEMGGVADSLTVAVGSGGAACVLVQSLFTWLQVRDRSRHTKLTLKTEDGREAIVDISSAADSEAVLALVSKFFTTDGSRDA